MSSRGFASSHHATTISRGVYERVAVDYATLCVALDCAGLRGRTMAVGLALPVVHAALGGSRPWRKVLRGPPQAYKAEPSRTIVHAGFCWRKQAAHPVTGAQQPMVAHCTRWHNMLRIVGCGAELVCGVVGKLGKGAQQNRAQA